MGLLVGWWVGWCKLMNIDCVKTDFLSFFLSLFSFETSFRGWVRGRGGAGAGECG